MEEFAVLEKQSVSLMENDKYTRKLIIIARWIKFISVWETETKISTLNSKNMPKKLKRIRTWTTILINNENQETKREKQRKRQQKKRNRKRGTEKRGSKENREKRKKESKGMQLTPAAQLEGSLPETLVNTPIPCRVNGCATTHTYIVLYIYIFRLRSYLTTLGLIGFLLLLLLLK